MSSFILAPSEAVLIGMFLEEYLQARQDCEKASVLDFIESHLRSFVPDMTVYSRTAVSEAALPPDTDWSLDSKVGVSLSTERVFERSGDEIRERIVVDQTRKSLADLVRDLVYPYAAKSLLDENRHLFAERQAQDEVIETRLLENQTKCVLREELLEDYKEERSKLERARAADIPFEFVEAQSCDFEDLEVAMVEDLEVAMVEIEMRISEIQASQDLQEGRKPEEVYADRMSKLSESVDKLSNSLEQLAEVEQAILALVERRGVDDEIAIEREIVQLINENELTEVFSVGRVVGRIRADCQRMEWAWTFLLNSRKESEEAIGGPPDEALFRGVVRWKLRIPEHFWGRYEAGLRELVALPRLESLTYAPLVIDRELSRLPTDRIRFVGRGLLQVASFSRLAQIRVLLGMIVGELVSSLRGDDAAVWERDAKSSLPRIFASEWSDPKDATLGPVALIEREFNERTAFGLRLESMVKMLSHTVEGLVKTVWPSDFGGGGRRSDFGKALDEKAARSIDQYERQFARHAQHLYKQYRNTSEHDQNFRVSYLQVLYFVSGIRVLYELAQKIQRARQASDAKE